MKTIQQFTRIFSIFVFILLIHTQLVYAQITIIGGGSCVTVVNGWPSGADLSETITLGAEVPSGGTVEVFFAILVNRTVTITDGGSNSWGSAQVLSNTTGGVGTVGSFALRLTNASTTFTVTLDGSANGFAFACAWSNGADPIDVEGTDTRATSGVTTHEVDAPITTSVSNSVFVGWGICSNGNYTKDADYTAIVEQGDAATFDYFSGYRIFSTTASNEVMTVTSAASETCDIALVAIAGLSGSTTRGLMLMGIGQ